MDHLAHRGDPVLIIHHDTESIEVLFVVPGQPVPKARPRMTCTGHVYTPGKTTKYEHLVAACYRQAAVGLPPHDGPVTLTVQAMFARPKRRTGEHWCVVRPDWDNVGKIVSDALNGLAYHDDSQVVHGAVTKQYAVGEPCVRVTVKMWHAK